MNSRLPSAIIAGNVDTVRDLLAETPELVNRRIPDGQLDTAIGNMTPLHLAIQARSTDIARLLIDAGADLSARNDDGRTPLHDSVEYGMHEVQEALIDNGAEIDVNIAAILGKADLLREILQRDPSQANDDSTNLSPLGWAAYGNQIETAGTLIESGARTDGGELLCAASVDHLEICEFLLDKGFDVNFFHEGSGANALHAAASMQYTDDSTRVVRLLLARGADPSISSKTGKTALEMAEAGEVRQAMENPERRKNYRGVIEMLEVAAHH